MKIFSACGYLAILAAIGLGAQPAGAEALEAVQQIPGPTEIQAAPYPVASPVTTVPSTVTAVPSTATPVKSPVTPASPQAAPKVTVPPASPAHRLMLIPFENHLKDQDVSISNMAVDTLQNSLLKPENRLFRLIDRRQVKAMLTELAFSESALSDQTKALKLGKLLSANLMLTGSISAGKIHTSEVTNLHPTEYTWATVQVSVTLTQVETGEILFSSKAEGISEKFPTWTGETFTSIILDAVEAASTDLAGQLSASKNQIAALLAG